MKSLVSIVAGCLAFVALAAGCGGGGEGATTGPAPPAAAREAPAGGGATSPTASDGTGDGSKHRSRAGANSGRQKSRSGSKEPEIVPGDSRSRATAKVVEELLEQARRKPVGKSATSKGVLEALVPRGGATGKGSGVPEPGSHGASGTESPVSPPAAVREILEKVRAGQ